MSFQHKFVEQWHSCSNQTCINVHVDVSATSSAHMRVHHTYICIHTYIHIYIYTYSYIIYDIYIYIYIVLHIYIYIYKSYYIYHIILYIYVEVLTHVLMYLLSMIVGVLRRRSSFPTSSSTQSLARSRFMGLQNLCL